MATGELVRSTTDRKIAGVCGGMAAYFNIDPTLMRILWVVVFLAGFGLGLVIYVVLWIVLPEGGTGAGSSALQIAQQRYARGEITAEELARIREDLRS